MSKIPPAAKPDPDSIRMEKQEQAKSKTAEPKVYSESERKARVEAYLRLVQLGAAPSVTFDAQHDALYASVYAEAVKEVEQERYDEIIKNRKVLDLGVGHDQMNVPEPAPIRVKREREVQKNTPGWDKEALVIGSDNKIRTQENEAARQASGGVQTTAKFGN